jgi:SNF2 family DNA or RNA helicase
LHIVHGTWFPEETDDYIQDGTFCLWVETETSARRPGQGTHPRQLGGAELKGFLADKLGFQAPYGGDLARSFREHRLLLPTAGGQPLPSLELLPYMELEIPETWQMAPWTVCSFPISPLIPTLNDLHFRALLGADDFQLGADLVFWYQFTQVLRGIITGDQYIPALKYHALEAGKKGRKPPAYELLPGWELLSPEYRAAVAQYAACMPAVCRAASDEGTDLYSADTLLRHFSERMLRTAVVGTPLTAKYEQLWGGTLLSECFAPIRPLPASDAALERYQQWANWRAQLTEAQTGAEFTLCFLIEEATAETPDCWRIHFLAASKRDPAFRMSLAEYWSLDEREKERLSSLLGADAEKHILLALGHAARIYPLVWTGLETDRPAGFEVSLREAFDFLREQAPVLESAGYRVIVPSWWTPEGRRRARVRVKTKARSNGSPAAGRSYFGLETVIDYQYQLSIGGEPVSREEWEQLVAAKTPLVHFRGQWVELDPAQIERMLASWEQRELAQPELTILDLMKIDAESDSELEWEHDPALDEVLGGLQERRGLEPVPALPNFHGELRPYQKQGVSWLRYLERLGLSACLADDMGLGKTVEVIAHLVAERNEEGAVGPTLLVVPTSVLGNWRKEIERFAPHLRVLVHQGPGRIKQEAVFRAMCAEHDVVVTSFALARLDEKLLRAQEWRRVVVDEAQNIKNPQAAQTKAIGKLRAQRRLALTGTPVENRLRDLWSIFHFLNPGYLGKEPQFRKAFEIPIHKENDPARTATLRRLVEPLILRRLKTDPRIIDDLPDKIEQKVYCNLTAEQASLYEAVVKDVEEQIENAEGIQRRGLILATLMRLKQICNHPAQFLQDGSAFSSERSHKLQRLAEMLEEVLDNGESLLIFTQFTEIGGALERFIAHTLHYPTYYLHGGTSARRREQLVAAFQDPESDPAAFVLSVRAGGTGLTLTRANHVFHFDRWWNPAVEDQATDRAFRIGQRKNVFAHKFVALGTVEERIDAMIEEKRGLAATIVGSDESWLTELDNQTFKELIALRRSAVVEV